MCRARWLSVLSLLVALPARGEAVAWREVAPGAEHVHLPDVDGEAVATCSMLPNQSAQ